MSPDCPYMTGHIKVTNAMASNSAKSKTNYYCHHWIVSENILQKVDTISAILIQICIFMFYLLSIREKQEHQLSMC